MPAGSVTISKCIQIMQQHVIISIFEKYKELKNKYTEDLGKNKIKINIAKMA